MPGQRLASDHARKALRTALTGPPPPRSAREPVFTYGPDVLEALRFVWAAADGPTGQAAGAR